MRFCCLTTVTELLVISGTVTFLCGAEANGDVPAWVAESAGVAPSFANTATCFGFASNTTHSWPRR